MSRIGKEPVKVESGVTVTLDGPVVTVKGPKGELSWTLPAGIVAEQKDGLLRFARSADDRQSRANHGLARALVANMVEGVTKGYAKSLDIEGVGFKFDLQGKDTLLLSIGYANPKPYKIPACTSTSPASTSSSSAASPRTSAPSSPPNPTRARASATRARRSAARKARPSPNGRGAFT